MGANSIRIVCNRHTKKFSYFYKNEIGEWLLLSKSSPLSRYKYVENFSERCEEILEIIDAVYNRKNKGVDLHFEGNEADFNTLETLIKNKYENKRISCKKETLGIAVLGKSKAGKTQLIETIIQNQGGAYQKSLCQDHEVYTEFDDTQNSINWYEFKGLDIGAEQGIEGLQRTIEELSNSDLHKIVYCISGESARIEECETFLIQIHKYFPSIDVVTVVTNGYMDQASSLVTEIEKELHTETVFLTNLIEHTSHGTSNDPFGVDEIEAYLIEGKKLPRNFSKKEFENSPDIETAPFDNDSQEKQSQESVEKPMQAENDDGNNIVVLGRCASGKTTLIKGINNYLQLSFSESKEDDYFKYKSSDNTTWYEIKGIDLGVGETDRVFSVLEKLVDKKTIAIVYCITGNAIRLDDAETDLIKRISSSLNSTKLIVVMTNCYQEKQSDLSSVLSEFVPKDNLIQTLAMPLKNRKKNGKKIVIPSFGLDKLTEAMKIK